jgi:catechol 2,3-dioxygenase-like lactoylglutathione lyase family enzyme
MRGPKIAQDMGELVPAPVAVKAAIVGFAAGGDRVLEVIEYPEAPGRPRRRDAAVTDHGLTHVGLVCDDVEATRAALEAKGVRFLTTGTASLVGVRTTWFADPYGVVFILVEKRHSDRPYYRQV